MGDIHDGTGAGMIAFLEWAGTKGEINDARANNLRTAASRVLAIEADPSSVDVTSVDVEALFDRFATLNRAKYNSASMQAYRSRFRQAVFMYRTFLNDDSSAAWKSVGAPTKSSSRNGDASAPGRTKPTQKRVIPKARPDEPLPRFAAPTDRSSQLVAYDLPLRPDLLVRLTLPVSLTKADADRIARFVQSLAFWDETPSPTTSGDYYAEGFSHDAP